MPILTEANHDETQRICDQAISNSTILAEIDHQLERCRQALAYWEENKRYAEKKRERYNGEIKALGYHDIGHARTELNQKEKARTAKV